MLFLWLSLKHRVYLKKLCWTLKFGRKICSNNWSNKKLAKKAGKPKWEVEEVDYSLIKKKISAKFEDGLRTAFKEIDKKEIYSYFWNWDTMQRNFAEDEIVTENQVMSQLKSLEKDIVRTAILKKRKNRWKRFSRCKTNKMWSWCFTRAHGSALLPEEKPKLLSWLH